MKSKEDGAQWYNDIIQSVRSAWRYAAQILFQRGVYWLAVGHVVRRQPSTLQLCLQAVPQLLRAALSKTTPIRWMAVASEGTRRRKGGWAISAQM